MRRASLGCMMRRLFGCAVRKAPSLRGRRSSQMPFALVAILMVLVVVLVLFALFLALRRWL
jgi:hypothetical protein